MKEFFCTTTPGEGDYSKILKGLGKQPVITKVTPWNDVFGDAVRVYHTGPDWGLYVVSGEGFAYQNPEGDILVRKWD